MNGLIEMPGRVIPIRGINLRLNSSTKFNF